MDGLPVNQLLGFSSGWLIVALGALAIMRGGLIPKSSHDREIAAKDAEIDRRDHEAQEWRTEGRIKDQQLQVKDEQLAEKDVQLRHMSEVGRTVETVMGAVQSLLNRPTKDSP